ncbi:hypothetical protein KEM52_005639 [Ascosphaera acerosa]|nr:hypothetical protein KEM52_005639 [Ascosphaera acerosa]
MGTLPSRRNPTGVETWNLATGMPAYFFHVVIDLLGLSLPESRNSPSLAETSQLAARASLSSIARAYEDAFKPLQPPRARSGVVASQQWVSLPICGPDDLRVSPLSLQSIDMRPKGSSEMSADSDSQITTGIGTGVLGGLATRGEFVASARQSPDCECGCVHLYREANAMRLPGTDDDDSSYLQGSGLSRRTQRERLAGAAASAEASTSRDLESLSLQDCKVLCILAVPAYLSPADFLGFIGADTRAQVSHIRMIRTERANRYMVLMKFRNAQEAKRWQRNWNGKVFNAMEPETCHVVFVRSIRVRMEKGERPEDSCEARADDAHDHGLSGPGVAEQARRTSSLQTRPLAPPTPALIELPTCPVCLERMDETSGLLTIICQHVFHCTCLEKWKGSGCPVCRYTQNPYSRRLQSDSDGTPASCKVCHTEVNLWVCLICGSVGCGRYDEAHAIAHFRESGHAFAMDLDTQRVWDYAGDGYVHRIIQNQADGKLVELPAADDSALEPPDWSDAVPREKLDNMSLEYTHLLTSQLESQRKYFEEKVERAVDKAAEASNAAADAQKVAQQTRSELAEVQTEYATLKNETVPLLEREKDRAERRAAKFESLARKMEKQWQEEKTVNASLLEKANHLTKELEKMTAANADLSEQNRDLTFYITASERLKGQGEDVEGGSVTIGDAPKRGKKHRRKRDEQ